MKEFWKLVNIFWLTVYNANLGLFAIHKAAKGHLECLDRLDAARRPPTLLTPDIAYIANAGLLDPVYY